MVDLEIIRREEEMAEWIREERAQFTLASVAILEIVFWVSVWYWKLIDTYDLFGWKSKYAIRNKRKEASKDLKRECLNEVFIGHFLIRPILIYVMYPFLKTNLDMSYGMFALPDLQTVFVHLFLSAQIDDFLFYWYDLCVCVCVHHPLLPILTHANIIIQVSSNLAS